MSRLARLSHAQRLELVERGADDAPDAITELDVEASYVNVGGALQAIYRQDAVAVVVVNNNRSYRFTMADEDAAASAVRTLARIASAGGSR